MSVDNQKDDLERAGIRVAHGANKKDFVNEDGSWNLNCTAVKHVMAKHDLNGSPFAKMTKADDSKLMADEGRRLDIADTIFKLGKARARPNDEAEMYERLHEYFAICQHNKVPPTYPLFAVWCGMSIKELEGSHARLHNLKNAVDLCRETIRGFLELSAMDNALSPLIYFHQQKVYFGAVETAKVQIEEVKSNAEELEEINNLLDSFKPKQANVIDVKDVSKEQ